MGSTACLYNEEEGFLHHFFHTFSPFERSVQVVVLSTENKALFSLFCNHSSLSLDSTSIFSNPFKTVDVVCWDLYAIFLSIIFRKMSMLTVEFIAKQI